MKRLAAVFLFFLPITISAQHWSVSIASGPFVFGDFAETRERIAPQSNGSGSVVTHSLSASTRAGGAAGFERYFNDRLSLRLEATFTESPLAVKSGSNDDSVSLDIADLSVTTLALPFVFRFNRGGSIRPLIYAGPAYVIYDIDPEVQTGLVPLFSGDRGRIGGIGGAGLEWWWNENFAVRGSISDIVSDSPLERSDFSGPPPGSVEIKTAHNVHTTVGIAYRW